MEPVVQTSRGAVRGRASGGVVAFRGIPYAAPPFGPDRLLEPVPHEPWDCVRDATEYGPTAPQRPYREPYDGILPNPIVPGEDCLNLNVWTPEGAAGGLPVVVWIHGGSFVNGSGAVPTYEGSRFARDGVVCVTLNYRLGVDGFALLAGAPANRGLLDQVAALEWVRDNIAAFGGDPAAVTIFGESAGGMSVTSLLSMPRARGLFRRAIAQSGAGHHVISAATAERIAAMLAERLGVEPTREGIASVPVAALLDAQTQLGLEATVDRNPQRWGEVALNAMAWEPVVDGDVLPARPIDGIAAGEGAGVDLLTGTTANEQHLFLVPIGMLDAIDDELAPAMASAYGLAAGDLDLYRLHRPQASPGEILAAVVTDWFFRVPAIRLAEAHASRGGSSHLYEFTWRSPQFGGRLGACHALELPFVFDTLGSEGAEALTGPEPPQGLATAMHGAWVAFAKTGDPGWPRYEPRSRITMRLGDECATAEDPHGDERELWDAIR